VFFISYYRIIVKADQADLKKTYAKAVKKGCSGKASAKESFLISEGNHGQRKPEYKKCGRYTHRAGIVKSVGNQKERIKRVAV